MEVGEIVLMIRQLEKMHTLWSISLRKISKIGAARCQILRLKCTKLPSGVSMAQDPLAVYLGRPTSKGREGKGK